MPCELKRLKRQEHLSLKNEKGKLDQFLKKKL